MTLIYCRTDSSCVFHIRNTGCCILQFGVRVMLCGSKTLGAVVLCFVVVLLCLLFCLLCLLSDDAW